MLKTFRVYGDYNHRNKVAFENSRVWDFSSQSGIRRINIRCHDVTGTFDYVELEIERENAYDIYKELSGQIDDGLFENCRTGKVTEIDSSGYEIEIDPLAKANACKESA